MSGSRGRSFLSTLGNLTGLKPTSNPTGGRGGGGGAHHRSQSGPVGQRNGTSSSGTVGAGSGGGARGGRGFGHSRGGVGAGGTGLTSSRSGPPAHTNTSTRGSTHAQPRAASGRGRPSLGGSRPGQSGGATSGHPRTTAQHHAHHPVGQTTSGGSRGGGTRPLIHAGTPTAGLMSPKYHQQHNNTKGAEYVGSTTTATKTGGYSSSPYPMTHTNSSTGSTSSAAAAALQAAAKRQHEEQLRQDVNLLESRVRKLEQTTLDQQSWLKEENETITQLLQSPNCAAAVLFAAINDNRVDVVRDLLERFGVNAADLRSPTGGGLISAEYPCSPEMKEVLFATHH